MTLATDIHPRILVIDDEPDICETLESVLSLAGYAVSTAASGAAAIERAKGEAFDLVITDLRMPGLSGVDTVAALKRLNPRMAAIVVSGYASEEAARLCCEEGAAQIVDKPFDLDDLLRAVRAALHEPRAERAAPHDGR
ncbi:MAG: response regulator [Minicystis sp.]